MDLYNPPAGRAVLDVLNVLVLEASDLAMRLKSGVAISVPAHLILDFSDQIRRIERQSGTAPGTP